ERLSDLAELLIGEHGVDLPGMHAFHVLERLEGSVLEGDLDAHADAETIPRQARYSGHHANAWFARCAQGPSMPAGRAERAVEANAKSIDAPRAQRHAEKRDGRRAQRNRNPLPDRWRVRGQDLIVIATRSSHDSRLITLEIAATRAAHLR